MTATKETKKTPLTTISTTLKETEYVDIDGEMYKIYGREHIGEEQEVELMSLFKRHERWQKQYETSKKDALVRDGAKGMRDARLEIITTFTDIPDEVASKIPLFAQAELLNVIAVEMGFASDEDSEE